MRTLNAAHRVPGAPRRLGGPRSVVGWLWKALLTASLDGPNTACMGRTSQMKEAKLIVWPELLEVMTSSGAWPEGDKSYRPV